jgi:hypothetical protein
MQQDYERLKQEENDMSNRLQELMYVSSVDFRASGICICCWIIVNG